jgi:hypothetical protein
MGQSKMKKHPKYYDFDASLKNFIMFLARKYEISDDDVEKLIDLIFEYGYRQSQIALGR